MSATMTDRPRLQIDMEEELRLAVRLAAMKSGQSVSELVNSILRQSLAEELADAKKYAGKKRKKD